MKQTCFGCRALNNHAVQTRGYKIKDTHSGPRPEVDCPKPRTNSGLVHWLSLKTARGGRPPIFEVGDNKHGPK